MELYKNGELGDEVKIYRVRLHIWEVTEEWRTVTVVKEDHIIIGNSEMARLMYDKMYELWGTRINQGCRGEVELFEAFIYSDGSISHAPKMGRYIERVTTVGVS